jgi:hypothetical protein
MDKRPLSKRHTPEQEEHIKEYWHRQEALFYEAGKRFSEVIIPAFEELGAAMRINFSAGGAYHQALKASAAKGLLSKYGQRILEDYETKESALKLQEQLAARKFVTKHRCFVEELTRSQRKQLNDLLERASLVAKMKGVR